MTEIACSLGGGAGAMRQRVDEWRAVVAKRTGWQPADGGMTLTFAHDADVAAELARLGAAEFACCPFFTFGLAIGPEGMRFTVTAPPAARDMVATLFGDPAD